MDFVRNLIEPHPITLYALRRAGVRAFISPYNNSRSGMEAVWLKILVEHPFGSNLITKYWNDNAL